MGLVGNAAGQRREAKSVIKTTAAQRRDLKYRNTKKIPRKQKANVGKNQTAELELLM